MIVKFDKFLKTLRYNSIGSLMMRVEDKDSVEKKLNEKKVTIDIQIKALHRQEKSLLEKYQAVQMDYKRRFRLQKKGRVGHEDRDFRNFNHNFI